MRKYSIKKQISRYLPNQQDLQKHYYFRRFNTLIRQPRLWHCNRHSIAIACFIGLFVAMIPLPMQMLIAASSAALFQANLPLSVSLVWISNPITMPPLFYFAYQLGAKLLQLETVTLSSESLSLDSIASNFLSIWLPLLTGSLLLGTLLGLAGFYTVNWIWRRNVLLRWHLRKQSTRSSNSV